MKPNVVILAAGKGTRMKSSLPKVMHNICGKPLLWYSICIARAVSKSEPIVVIGHKAELVQKELEGEKIRWVKQKGQLGTGHAVLACENILKSSKESVVVLNADLPLLQPEALVEMIKKQRKKHAACVVMTTNIKNPFGYGRILRSQDGSVSKIVEERDSTGLEKTIMEVNSGAYVFDCVERFKALKKVKTDNAQKEYYLPDALAVFVKSGKKVLAHKVEDEKTVYSVTTRWDLPNISSIIMLYKMKRLAESGVTIVSPQNTIIDVDVEIGAETIIYPFTVIESGVKIGQFCKVGPFSHLRKGSILEDYAEIGNFVECKKTTLGAYSKAKHLSYLGDAIIGKKVNIGAGTICANYDGKNKHVTKIDDGAHVGSGTVFVAPVKMGKNAVTGAGAIVTRNKDIPDGETHIGVPAKQRK
ncbi:MAG: NTP transferase domain-containing protein [Planctomycetota bacterium]